MTDRVSSALGARTSIAVALTTLLVLGVAQVSQAAPTGASATQPDKHQRVVEIQYAGAGVGTARDGSGQGQCPIHVFDPQEICMTVSPMPGERYVHVEFKDLAGQKVSGNLVQKAEAAGPFEVFGKFCGAHEEPVKLPSSTQKLQIFYFNGTCEGGEPSIVTTGTIKVTFSKHP